MKDKFEIDWLTAQRITALCLKDYRDNMSSDLKKWRKNPKTESNPTGVWMHAEDVAGNIRRIDIIEEILKDFEVPQR